MRHVFRYQCLLAVTALLLQLGMGSAAQTQELASHPAGSAMVMLHEHDCAGDECPADDCPTPQCDTGTSPACHCSCAQISLLVGGELTFETNPPSTTAVSEIMGTAPRRLDRPFRPPA